MADKGEGRKPLLPVEEAQDEGETFNPPFPLIVLACPVPEAEKPETETVEGKKPLFQRLWNDDDEIVILQGMIDYKAEKGIDPLSDADDFLGFVRNSLHVVDVSSSQIVNKIRTLKKKFRNTMKKKIVGTHGRKLLELSKKIWGCDDDDHDVKIKNHPKGSGSVLNSDKEKGGVHDEMNLGCKRKLMMEDLGDLGFLKDGFDEGKLYGKRRKQYMAELEVYLKRLDLIKEMTQKTLDSINSAQ